MDNKKMKYITYRVGDDGLRGFIFPCEIDHDRMQKRLGVHHTSVIGAGFCKFVHAPLLDSENVLQVRCYGESISMNVKSSMNDGMILTSEYLGLGYTLD